MAKPSVCIEMLLTEFPFVERIAKVRELGYPAVEFWFTGQNPNDPGAEERAFGDIAEACSNAEVSVATCVVNSPDGAVTGSLVRPSDRERYLARLEQVIRLAGILDCRTVITCSGNVQPDMTQEAQIHSIVDTLSAAGPIAQDGGVTLVLEPLNTLVDHAGYFLDSSALAAEIVRTVNHPSVRLLYDVYHMQIMEGNIISTIRRNLDIIGHFHSAGVPGRNELTSGELNYHDIIAEIDALGYGGYFGLEYRPLLESTQSLSLVRESLMLW